MKKCPHGGEVLRLELTDFDLRAAIENALILVREQDSRRGIAPVARAPVSQSRCRDIQATTKMSTSMSPVADPSRSPPAERTIGGLPLALLCADPGTNLVLHGQDRERFTF